jgi:hypothetical protein
VLAGDHKIDVIGKTNLNNAGTLVAESHIRLQKVLICAAKTGVGDADEHLIVGELAGCGGLHDLALLGALEHGECRHFEGPVVYVEKIGGGKMGYGETVE